MERNMSSQTEQSSHTATTASSQLPIYPASHAQRRFWLLDEVTDGSGAYHISATHILDGPLDLMAFRKAFYQLIDRHEVLRTSYGFINDQLGQRIHPASDVRLIEKDWTDASEEEVKRHSKAYLERAFQLEKAPPVLAVLAQLDEEKHLFMLSVHHIACDGISQSIMVRDLIEFYRAATTHEDPQLPTLTLQYKDFSVWQNVSLSDDQEQREWQFWQEQLATPPQPLDLPCDFPRPAVKTYNGDWVYRHLDPEPFERLRSQNKGMTTYTLLTALCKILLFRYTGNRDLIVGCAAAGREQPQLQSIVGCLINTLALRTRLNPDHSFTDTLAEVAETVTAALNHQHLPFDEIVSRLAPHRDPSRSPFFDVMVQLHNQEHSEVELDQVRLRPYTNDFNPSRFDLTFDFVNEPDGLRLGIFFNTDLFEKATIKRLADHFEMLLAQIAAHPNRPISQLDMLTPAEYDELDRWNNTEANWPQEANLVSLFQEQVERLGDRVAVRYEHVIDKVSDLSYAELDHLSGRVAAMLLERGARGKRVAVMLPRSERIPAVFLGILKAGAAYIPLDPDYPPERLQYMLEDSGCALAITDPSIADRFNPVDLEILTLAELPKQSAQPVEIPPQSPAYIIYTSGSTGQPKGCVITHANAVRLVENSKLPFAFDASDVWSCTHSFCFDYTIWETYACLLHGGTLVIARPDQMRDMSQYHQLLCRYKVTVACLTPGAFYNLIDFECSKDGKDLLSIDTVFLGGDRLELKHLKPWVDRYPLDQMALVNLYGITETTVVLTYKCLENEDLDAVGAESPIGIPLPETTAYVCRAGKQQPVGVPGELFVGGSGIGAGYLNRPALTAQRFLPDPFADETKPGARLYRTGDLVRRLGDGSLAFMGRLDHQVQVRGFRIETGEIEARLLENPTIEKAIVLGRENAHGHVELIAWVTGAHARPMEILDRLSGSLPAYMIPSRVVVLDKMPQTANGKLDRDALPDPDADPVNTGRTPSNDLERVLCGLFSELLPTARVGLDDTFFELGGDSLVAGRLTTRLSSWFGCDLNILDIFENPTVGFLATLLQERVGTRADKVAAVLWKMQGMSPEEKRALLASRKVAADSGQR